MAMLKNAQKKFNEVEGTETFANFCSWSITNWDKVMAFKFGWMTDKPAYPSSDFLCYRLSDFINLWKEDRIEGARWHITLGDTYNPEDEIHSRLLAGQTLDQAKQAVRDTLALKQREADIGKGLQRIEQDKYRKQAAVNEDAAKRARLAAEKSLNSRPVED